MTNWIFFDKKGRLVDIEEFEFENYIVFKQNDTMYFVPKADAHIVERSIQEGAPRIASMAKLIKLV